MKHLLLGCLYLALFSFNTAQSKMPSKGRLCSQGLILKQKQTKTIEWLIAWQNHAKRCFICTKRTGAGTDEERCPICLEPFGTQVETENSGWWPWKAKMRTVTPIILPVQDVVTKDAETQEIINTAYNCCGHSVCKYCLTDYFSRSNVRKCPICRTVIPPEFINENLGLGTFRENKIPYIINASCLLTLLATRGCLAGLTLGVTARKIMLRPTYNSADPQTIFALHYLALIASWIGTHKLIQKFWRPTFEVANPGRQFDLAASMERKSIRGQASILAGFGAGLLASKSLLREYENIAKILDT